MTGWLVTSNMVLNRSAKFGSFRAVTSFIAPFTDFSSESSFTSSVALTSLSPLRKTQYKDICQLYL